MVSCLDRLCNCRYCAGRLLRRLGAECGFKGGHFHDNWGNEPFRKVVLNALVWLAKAEVPADGVASHISEDDLHANLDPKK